MNQHPKLRHVMAQSRVDPQGHTCHADGCTKQIAPALFMCLPHWRQVPRDLQREIWRLYEPGQEQTKDASAEYLAVASRAIAAVAAS